MKTMLQYTDRLRRLAHKSMRPLGEELNLSQLEMELLLFLYNNPELNTARDAVAYRGFAKSNVSTAIEALHEKGWLTVEPDPESRRMKRLHLCAGREADLERLSVCQNGILSVLVSDFTPEEVETLRRLLDRMEIGRASCRERVSAVV